jgi:hypothetical protein
MEIAPASCFITSTPGERQAREQLDAHRRSMPIVAAGQATERRQRELGDMAAARVPSPHRVGPPLTIAPWLYER